MAENPSPTALPLLQGRLNLAVAVAEADDASFLPQHITHRARAFLLWLLSKRCAGKSQGTTWMLWEGMEGLQSREGEMGNYRGAPGRSLNHIFLKKCTVLCCGQGDEGGGKTSEGIQPSPTPCWHLCDEEQTEPRPSKLISLRN